MIRIVIAAALAFAAVLPAAPAMAQRDRVFVASYGSDANPCTFGSPCKTFQHAQDVVADSGEITAIDSAGFGPLNITHTVTITSPAGVEAGIAAPAPGAAAITINAASTSAIITLSGLTLNGAGVSNTTGIQFISGGSLSVSDCAIRNFTSNGILFAPNTPSPNQLFVSNTLVSDNGDNGISISPTGLGTTTSVLDHVKMQNNAQNGLNAASFGQTVTVAVIDSVSANNKLVGIFADTIAGTTVNIMVRNSTIFNNAVTGLEAIGIGATVSVTRSTITGNASGWDGAVLSYADNNIDGNTDGNIAPLVTLPYR